MTIDTSTAEGFRQARQILNLTVPEVARLIGTNERTVKRWETDETRPVHPTAATALDWFMDGYRPSGWPEKMTGPDMQYIRRGLGLSVGEMADVLDADEDTIEKWESGDRGPSPIVQTVLGWLRDGYRPANWPKDL